jgi:hypothetical protein
MEEFIAHLDKTIARVLRRKKLALKKKESGRN